MMYVLTLTSTKSKRITVKRARLLEKEKEAREARICKSTRIPNVREKSKNSLSFSTKNSIRCPFYIRDRWRRIEHERNWIWGQSLSLWCDGYSILRKYAVNKNSAACSREIDSLDKEVDGFFDGKVYPESSGQKDAAWVRYSYWRNWTSWFLPMRWGKAWRTETSPRHLKRNPSVKLR